MSNVSQKIAIVLGIIFPIFWTAWLVFYLCKLPSLAMICVGGELGTVVAEIVVGIIGLKEDNKEYGET